MGSPFAGKLALLPSMNEGGANGEEGPGECWEIGNRLAGMGVAVGGGGEDGDTKGPPLQPQPFFRSAVLSRGRGDGPSPGICQ